MSKNQDVTNLKPTLYAEDVAFAVTPKEKQVISAENVAFKIGKDNKLPKHKGADDYSDEAVSERIVWLEKTKNISLQHISANSEKITNFQGNIETPIGVAQIPLGIAGPIKVKGEFAKGEYYVPMATTEGVLLTSFRVGMKVLNNAGGVDVKVTQNVMHITSLFIINSINECQKLMDFINNEFEKIKEAAEMKTKFGKLKSAETMFCSNGVLIKFIYDTKDAMGMNMINIATKMACEYISKETNLKKYYVRSNYSSDKKFSYTNNSKGYGKEVFAKITLSKEDLRLLRISPKELFDFYTYSLGSAIRGGMIGFNGQVVNGITAIFIACGQDVAQILHSASSVSGVSLNDDGTVSISIYVPNLLVGTVGGGTSLGTQKECLKIMQCYGSGNVNKFAEIIVATILAGELSISASLANGSFFQAHEMMGRNRPKE
jgi:hydroxymethylglutaryl-CoA reductase (NADPH)